MRKLFAHLLPDLIDPEQLSGGVVVMFDVLRASTTMVHALAAGARAVVPCLEVDEARTKADALGRGNSVLGGERHGQKIPGFDLDNNPFAYTPEIVAGKTIVFTTSNGTRAILKSQKADRVLVGAFVNLSAVVTLLAADSRPVHLVCAGTNRQVSHEDVLCAGAVGSHLLQQLGLSTSSQEDDQLRLALDTWTVRARTPVSFRDAIYQSYGGRNCQRLGFSQQIDRAQTLDLFSIVPEWSPLMGEIRIAEEVA